MSDPFAGRAGGFDEYYGEPRGRIRLALVLERLREVLPPAPARILDAGGGTGAFAVPLAEMGHDVTIVDRSPDWLEVAAAKAQAAGVTVRFIEADLDGIGGASLSPFDAICCHGVLMYVAAPQRVLHALRAVARRGALLSIIDKNRDALALRPGVLGNYLEACRLLTERRERGRLDVTSHSHSMREWHDMLMATGWRTDDWAGIQLFSTFAPPALDDEGYRSLLDLERRAGGQDPYRQLARLFHLRARTAETGHNPAE